MTYLYRGLSFLFWSAVFGISYTQAPLYYSNQNQYFLHGLASAGHGNLDQDWLAGTRDPTPVFSAGVALTHSFLHETLFYAYYLLLQGLYFHCLVGLLAYLLGTRPGRLAHLLFATLLVAVHAGLGRLASVQAFGVDYPWYFQAGVAGQYVLGFGLQPSVFGVFLLASVYAFLRERPWMAVTWACLAAVVHSTYLLGAAFLVTAYLCVWWRQGQMEAGLRRCLFALGLVTPVVIHNLVSFAPSSAANFAKAQEILAHFRIPHHAEPQRWLDGIALGQVAWVALALLLVQKTGLFLILGIPFLAAVLLTLLQMATANDTLALLFPWRISVILVPLATAIILARLVENLMPWLGSRSPRQELPLVLGCAAVLAFCVGGGLSIMFYGLGYPSNPDEAPLLEYVREHRRRGDVYLLPVDVPDLAKARKGARSTNFTPAPRSGKNGDLIAIDLQRFRLSTGAANYVDFKAIPYQDVEVLEWQRRLLWSREFFQGAGWKRPGIEAELAERGITHVVTGGETALEGGPFQLVYEDGQGRYRLYRIRR